MPLLPPRSSFCLLHSKFLPITEPLYHPGLEGIIAGQTSVSSLAGGLSYRGYAIDELAHHARFDEVAYLLLYGDLPKKDALSAFRQRLAHFAAVPHMVIDVLRTIPAKAPLM